MLFILSATVYGEGLGLEDSAEVSAEVSAKVSIEGPAEVSNKPLNISGDFEQQKKNDRITKMKNMRKQMEQRNEELVKKQIEEIRFHNEMKMMKKIEKAFAENLQKLDQIQ